MNLQVVPTIDTTPNINCLIIPLHWEDKKAIEEIKQSYSLPGFDLYVDEIKKSNGQHVCFFIDQSNHPSSVILYNAEAENQAAQNLQTISLGVKNKSNIKGKVVLDARSIGSNYPDLEAIIRGTLMSQYNVGKYKTDNDEVSSSIEDFIIISKENNAEIEAIFHRAKMAAETIQSCMDLVNAPANKKTPIDMAAWLNTSAFKNNFEVEILEKPQLEKMGFHALLAVNRGSEIPAKCLIARYTGPHVSSSTPTIALVGKGVTFDTGGLSIKPSQNMYYMKSDMGGAAAVMGTIELVAKLGLPIKLVMVVPCTDNSVDSTAVKPGDVIGSYEGSTIEVIDTDAEGRLILADGLSYAIQTYSPDYIVDLATLTGSAVRTFGSHTAALMTNSDYMEETLSSAGNTSGDRVWPLPLWDEYAKYMSSDVADIRNLSTKPVGGAITAGKFLEHFTHEHKNWAHLDIAGAAFGTSSFSTGYSATGFGILLLLSWIEIILQK